jgi:hypothetical protein
MRARGGPESAAICGFFRGRDVSSAGTSVRCFPSDARCQRGRVAREPQTRLLTRGIPQSRRGDSNPGPLHYEDGLGLAVACACSRKDRPSGPQCAVDGETTCSRSRALCCHRVAATATGRRAGRHRLKARRDVLLSQTQPPEPVKAPSVLPRQPRLRRGARRRAGPPRRP